MLIKIKNHAGSGVNQHEPWNRLSWRQCILGTPLSHDFSDLQDVWSLIRGTVRWLLWIRQNAWDFRRERWHEQQIFQMLWEGILDHPRTHWYKILRMQKDQPLALPNAKVRFVTLWHHHRNHVFCEYDGFTVKWTYNRPQVGSFR
jgi:hypothetical protein